MGRLQRIGKTSRVHTCGHCGKKNLASTIAFRDSAAGKIVHFGAKCAATVRNAFTAKSRVHYTVETITNEGETSTIRWTGRDEETALREGRKLSERGSIVDVIRHEGKRSQLIQTWGA